MKKTALGVLASALLILAAATPPAAGSAEIDIPHARFVLDNGLTLIVHEDSKAPIVAVNVWYRELGFGEVQLIDTDDKAVAEPAGTVTPTRR